MKLKSKIAKFATSLAVLIALAAALTVNRVQAFRPTAVEYHLGIVGIAQGQTARLNVLNTGGETMNLSLNFRSLDGRPVRQRIVTVEGGQGASLDLRFPDADVTG